MQRFAQTISVLLTLLLLSLISLTAHATARFAQSSSREHARTSGTSQSRSYLPMLQQVSYSRSYLPLMTKQPQPPPTPKPGPPPDRRAQIEIARRWAADDAVVANGNSPGPWTWGAQVFRSMTEPYAEAPGGWRTVWYFDKGRLAVTYPNNDPDDPHYVTPGGLVVELISGRIRLGDRTAEVRQPADLRIVGDDVPASRTVTYQDLVPLASLNGDRRSPARTGATVTEVLGKDGAVTRDSRFGRHDVRISAYDTVKGHNLPDVFTDFMPPSHLFALAGYPLTEPYWIRVPIGGVQTDVLIQPFERRVLAYQPNRPEDQRIEWVNVGRRYAQWRYEQPQNVTPFDPRSLLDVHKVRPLAELSAEARRIADERQGDVGVAVFNMRSGEVFTFGGTRIFYTYSTVKTSIMLALLQQAHTQRRVITPEEDRLIRAMIQYSDNNATDSLYRRVGGARGVSDYLRRIGIDNIALSGNWIWSKTTPEEMARLLAKLGNCTILTPELCNYALEVMRGVTPSQRWGVSAGVSPRGAVAIKNGWWYSYTQSTGTRSGDEPEALIPPHFYETPDWAEQPEARAQGTIWTVNSSGFVKSDGKLYAIAVYTYPNPSMQYGIDTIEGISRNVYPALR